MIAVPPTPRTATPRSPLPLATVVLSPRYGGALGRDQTSRGFTRCPYRGTRPGPSRTSAASTSEVYGTIQLSRKYLAPRLAAYWDVDRVRGLYLESSGTLPIMANPLGEPFWALYVRGLAGYSLGQEVNPAQPDQVANFAHRGVTHVDLSLSFDLRPGPLTLHHESHVQYNIDDATRRTSADPADDRRVKFWFELSASWTPGCSSGEHSPQAPR